jgi:hypothetical protein
MMKVNNLAIFLAASGFVTLFSANAQTTATGSLSLQSLSVTGSGISWSGDWSLGSYTLGASTDGGIDFGTTSASVLYAGAASSGAAPNPDVSGLSGNVQGAVTLPGGFDEFGYTTAQSTFETSFTTAGGPQSVSFSAALASSLTAIADLSGNVLYSDDSFNLLVDNQTVLFFSDVVSAAPGQSAIDIQSPSLADTVSLADGTHDLYLELDTEQSAYTTPDTGGTFALLLLGAGSLAATARLARKRPARVDGLATLALEFRCWPCRRVGPARGLFEG